MGRAARRASATDVYHVVARGVGRQAIFEDDADRWFYLGSLRDELLAQEGELLAWCLMDNHVHLLVRMPLEELSEMMRTLGSTYALFFNRRHGRVGHLFQDRFRSEPVEDDAYLLTVVRYIHQNPVKAGMTPTCDYRWSSYQAYVGGVEPVGLTSTGLVLSMLGGEEAFARFHQALVWDAGCVDDEAKVCLRDDEARELAAHALGRMRPAEVADLPRPRRNEALRSLRGAGLTVRQIERLTGVPRSVVARAR